MAGEKPHIVRPALAKAGENGTERLIGHGGGGGEAIVAHAAFAGQHGKRDVLSLRHRCQLLDAIGPAVVTAEDADENEPGFGGRAQPSDRRGG